MHRRDWKPILGTPRTDAASGWADQAGLIVDCRAYYRAFYQAALKARRYIYLSGWEFDTKVELLRGEDQALAAEGHTRFVDFLNHLCETREDLEIRILCWDFHVILALEREWMQRLLFHWKTHGRLQFRFDEVHPEWGCHHQKFVVIDGRLAFLGGIDICDSRWDDREHAAENPLRVVGWRRQKPYHDVQAYLHGVEAVRPLEQYFGERWKRSGGEALEVPPERAGEPDIAPPEGGLRLPPGPCFFSRTDPRDPHEGRVCEVETLFERAIEAAECLIYFENQYFSSRAVRDFLIRRMRAPNRSRLQIVMLLNPHAEALKEEIAVGMRQTEILIRLREEAAWTGHDFRCYYTLAAGEDGRAAEAETYLHSKLVIVDDRLLSVGSTNLTNRSLGLDTELNVSWDAALHQRPGDLARAIRRVRVSLLAEHAGLAGVRAVRDLVPLEGLVDRLDRLAAQEGRLRLHPPPTPEQRDVLAVVDPQALPFDPAAPEDDPRSRREQERRLFRGGFTELWRRWRYRHSH